MNVPRLKPIDTSVYNRMMKFAETKPNNSIISCITEAIRRETGVNPFNNKVHRGERLVMARQLFMVLMAKYTDYSNKKIAEMVGKDRTTIYHSQKEVQNRRDTDKQFNQMYLRLETLIN